MTSRLKLVDIHSRGGEKDPAHRTVFPKARRWAQPVGMPTHEAGCWETARRFTLAWVIFCPQSKAVFFSSPLGGHRCLDGFDERCNKTKSDADPRSKWFSLYRNCWQSLPSSRCLYIPIQREHFQPMWALGEHQNRSLVVWKKWNVYV